MSAGELKLLNLPYHEARALDRAARRQEPTALAFFQNWIAEPGVCWLCDTALQAGEGTAAMLDDPRKRGMVLVARYCGPCGGLPTLIRLNKVIKLFRQMYPKWHPSRAGWRN